MSKEENPKQEKKNLRRKKHIAIYGNYKNYYGYRIGQQEKEDPRLSVLRREWFEGKDCLDIGCNQGLLTISIAKKFNCRHILGIDIDAGLIENADWNLKRIAKMDRNSGTLPKPPESEHEVSVSVGEERAGIVKESSPLEGNLLERVSFRKQNFVDKLQWLTEKYDTVVCFSVTKWIHLNWGDDGLIMLFTNIWRVLRPGGILVLEPQPWKSYQKNHQVSETATYNFHNILFPPDHFQDILLDKIGFRTVENITNALPGSVVGFDRPIFAYHK
ncbi:putative RNA methyltransferase [Acorus gramineus]|uniref:RNA methyltransferase n=1 Tax=Acorus gramineus TaxID=55184 RepID=A0AAV9ALT5_ACOGR|nr:putative RNA methyltransferase [Acorus gramineus]